MARKKKQFCPQGHDTFVVGRNKKNQCIECHKHPKPIKKIRKLFCSKNHNKNIVGIYKDGKCKQCVLDRCKKRHEKYKEKINFLRRIKWPEYIRNNPLTFEQKIRKKITDKEWNKNNRGSINARNIKAATNRNLRIVDWTDWNKIKEIYTQKPNNAEVDHYIPLQGKFISGLHVSWNLQYLTVHENRTKLSKIDLLNASEWYGKILEEVGLK